MLQLTRGKRNQLSSTLKDNDVPGSGTFYLFEFQSKATQDKVYFLPTVSIDNSRETRYTIDLTNNQLEFGQYWVRVYRQTSETNKDPDDNSVDGLIYTIEAFVDRGDNDTKIIYYSPTISNTVVYSGV